MEAFISVLPFPMSELNDRGTNKGPIKWLHPLETTFSRCQRGEAIMRRRGQGSFEPPLSLHPLLFLFFIQTNMSTD